MNYVFLICKVESRTSGHGENEITLTFLEHPPLYYNDLEEARRVAKDKFPFDRPQIVMAEEYKP